MATTYDVHVEPLTRAEAEGAGVVYTFRYAAAVGVRGTQKMINRWAKCLLTEKGSDLSDPSYGTVFAGLIGGNVSVRGDLTDALLISVDDCTQQMQALDSARLAPDDERIASARVVDVVEVDDGIEAWVELRSVAGTIARLPLPVIGGLR